MKITEMAALSLCDGMGNPDNTGSYVLISNRPKGALVSTLYRISKGGAESLVAELNGVLAMEENPPPESIIDLDHATE